MLYTGLELGMSAYVPRSPAETLDRGYGDCKDKAVVLVSELRQLGVPAYLALLRAYPAPEVNAYSSAAPPGVDCHAADNSYSHSRA